MKYPNINISPLTAALAAAAIAAGYVLIKSRRDRAAEAQHREECLDHTLEDSFPASDPPSF
ncbi:MAG: hypothetical protein IT185_01980 [Acidobacteria bacterium]|nr:hypothetical protein [Acidobacteriota bacterium]